MVINMETSENSKVKDHLANERTFLAWVRTSIGIMAFGFVIEKFSLFLQKISVLMDLPSQLFFLKKAHLGLSNSYYIIFGIVLVAFGSFVSLFSYLKYKRIQNQIISNRYQPVSFLDITLVTAIFVMGVFLTIYLITSNIKL